MHIYPLSRKTRLPMKSSLITSTSFELIHIDEWGLVLRKLKMLVPTFSQLYLLSHYCGSLYLLHLVI